MPQLLGRLPSPVDHRNLYLANYLDLSTVPPAPTSVDWTTKSKYPMSLNDQLSNCVIAADGHQLQTWLNQNGNTFSPADNDILKAYEQACGYVNGRPGTDQGCNILAVLKYWQNTGICGHKIGPYVQVDNTNQNEIKQAVYLFGGVIIGVNLPKAVQGQKIWDNPIGSTRGNWAPGSWGGHAVCICKFDTQYYVVTWGMVIPVTWRFLQLYCDEMRTILSSDWLTNNKAPNGFDSNLLYQDMKDITGKTPVGPAPIPVPVNPPPVNPPVNPPPINPPPTPRPTVGQSITIDGIAPDNLSVEGWRCSKIDD